MPANGTVVSTVPCAAPFEKRLPPCGSASVPFWTMRNFDGQSTCLVQTMLTWPEVDEAVRQEMPW
jgi:hypothetical protein